MRTSTMLRLVSVASCVLLLVGCGSAPSADDRSVNSVAFSSDGTRVAAGIASASFSGDDNEGETDSGELRVLSAADGSTISRATYPNIVWAVAWSPDGTMVATANDDKRIRVYRASDGTLLQTLFGAGRAVWSVAWSPDGTLIAGGSADNSIRLYDARSGTLLNTLTGHTGAYAGSPSRRTALRWRRAARPIRPSASGP